MALVPAVWPFAFTTFHSPSQKSNWRCSAVAHGFAGPGGGAPLPSPASAAAVHPKARTVIQRSFALIDTSSPSGPRRLVGAGFYGAPRRRFKRKAPEVAAP